MLALLSRQRVRTGLFSRFFPLLAAAAALLAMPAAPSQAAGPAGDAALLRQMADRWDRAIVAKQRAAIEAHMAEDFRQIGGSGEVEDKRSFVEGLMDPKLTINPYTVEDFELRQYGNVALLSGRTRMTGVYDGKPISTHYRYIDVYVKRSGQWKIVSVQITKIEP